MLSASRDTRPPVTVDPSGRSEALARSATAPRTEATKVSPPRESCCCACCFSSDDAAAHGEEGDDVNHEAAEALPATAVLSSVSLRTFEMLPVHVVHEDAMSYSQPPSRAVTQAFS